MKLWIKNLLLVFLALLIAAFPLILIKDSEFSGTDGAAIEAASEISPGFAPWISSVFELPGGEMETLLFSVQAAIGAGIVGFILGRITAKVPEKPQDDDR